MLSLTKGGITMATVKSFTSLEQSRKLAKILPLETADMYWWFSGKRYYIEAMDDGDFNEEEGHVRAWSLAALLGVLPKRIELEGVAYELSIYLNGLYYWNVNNGNLLLEVKGKDNLVDACVAMIEKLNELNLL